MITRDFSDDGKWIIATINFLFIVLLSWRTITGDSDSAPLVYVAFYGLIFIFNLSLWILLAVARNKLVREIRRFLFSVLILLAVTMVFLIK
jgi:hypothetical protein